jgi:hypothetical protein
MGMDTILILAGIACIIGAIIGGGVKLVHVEVSPISSLRRQIFLAVFGAVLVLSGLLSDGVLRLRSADKAGQSALANDSDAAPANSVSPDETPSGPVKPDAPEPHSAPQNNHRTIKEDDSGKEDRKSPSDDEVSSNDTQRAMIDCSKEGGLSSAKNNDVINMRIFNHRPDEIKFYWLDFNGERVPYGTVPGHSNKNQITVSGHYWLIADAHDTCIGIWDAADHLIIK